MSWFKNSDLEECREVKNWISHVADVGKPKFLTDKKTDSLKKAIGELDKFDSLFYLTDGAWNNIDLVGYVLDKTGPANIYFSSWSISTDAIRRFQDWQAHGQVQQIYAILDQGIRNRKPEILQQATSAFANLKLIKCHAKTMVIDNERFHVTLMGSANLTANPRKEVGIIVQDKELADHSITWILEEFANV